MTDNGPSDAVAVSVTDTLPAGVTFVSAAGTGWACSNTGNVSVTCTRPGVAAGTTAPPISVVVTAPVANGTLTNVADVSSATPDPDPTNDSASLSTDVGPAADVSITKTGPATAAPGSTLTYSLTVSNAGPSDATAVSVTDTLPAGVTFVSATGTGWGCSSTGNVSVTCTRPTIVAGATAPVVTVAVAAPMHAATLLDTATAANAVLDPDLGNNTATATTTVGAVADVSLVKTGPASVTVGGQVAYHLTVHNAGPDAAADLSVVDALPAGVTLRVGGRQRLGLHAQRQRLRDVHQSVAGERELRAGGHDRGHRADHPGQPGQHGPGPGQHARPCPGQQQLDRADRGRVRQRRGRRR